MFPYQISDRGVTVFIDSKPRQFAVTHGQYNLIVEAIHAGDMQAVRAHSDVAQSVTLRTEGRVRIENDCIFVNDKQIHGNIVDRILAMIAMRSEAVKGLIRFLDRTYDNCSKSTIDNLFDFIEACDLPITDDGCFLTYKYVTHDFKDCHTGTFDNSVGAKPRMPRNEVDDRRDVTCSTGLHVCSLEYIGSQGNTKPIIVCKVAPEDVVCVPHEYKMAKMRTEGYEVVDVLDFSGGERLNTWYDDQYTYADVGDSVETVPESDPVVDELEEPEAATEAATVIVNNLKPAPTIEFNGDEVAKALDAIGPVEANIFAYLETLDDELENRLHDWDMDRDCDSNVRVLIWLDSDTVGLDHTVLYVEPNTVVAKPKKGSAKLNADQVREIKSLKDAWNDGDVTLTAIGAKYGVHREQIARIFRGETWKHIT